MMSQLNNLIIRTQSKDSCMLKIARHKHFKGLNILKKSLIEESHIFKNIVHDTYYDFTKQSSYKLNKNKEIRKKSSVFPNDHVFKQHLHREQFEKLKLSHKNIKIGQIKIQKDRWKSQNLSKCSLLQQNKKSILFRKKVKKQCDLNNLIQSMTTSKLLDKKTQFQEVHQRIFQKVRRYKQNNEDTQNDIIKMNISTSEIKQNFLQGKLQNININHKYNRIKYNKTNSNYKDSSFQLSNKLKQKQIKHERSRNLKTNPTKEIRNEFNSVNDSEYQQLNKIENLNPWANTIRLHVINNSQLGGNSFDIIK